jgi:hypothetical protein
MFANLKVKDAIVDRVAGKTGSRPDSGKDKNNVVVQFYWKDDCCWLYLNTSGQKLSDRSYRKMPHKAPLRESLAAAIITATDYDGSEPLVCPMCGSGTLAIEAALIASRRLPGLLRNNFGFMHFKYFEEPRWRQMRSEALKISKIRGGKADFKPARIIATDIDAGAVEAARKNAMTAGVSHLIDFDVCDFADTVIPPCGLVKLRSCRKLINASAISSNRNVPVIPVIFSRAIRLLPKKSDCVPADDLNFLMPTSNAVCLSTNFMQEQRERLNDGAFVYLCSLLCVRVDIMSFA